MPYLYEHFFGVYPSDILFAHSSEPVCLKAKDEMIHLTLNDWSQGKQWILFPKNLSQHWDSMETKLTGFPRDQSLSDLLYSRTKRLVDVMWKQLKTLQYRTLKNELVKRYDHTTFSHVLFTCNGGLRSTFAGNIALLPSEVILDFAMLPAQRLLAGTSFIVRCHVILNWPMRARTIRGKIPAI